MLVKDARWLINLVHFAPLIYIYLFVAHRFVLTPHSLHGLEIGLCDEPRWLCWFLFPKRLYRQLDSLLQLEAF